MLWLDTITILVAGTMFGNEFAVAAFVHPALTRLSDREHLAGAQSLARVLGRVMPFWYASVLLALLAETILRRTWSIGLSTALWASTIVYTVAVLVPINNRIADWDASSSSSEWKVYRVKWDHGHGLRVAVLGSSLTLLVWALLRG